MSANNCTVELFHGGRIHVAEDFDVMDTRWSESILSGHPMRVRRMEGHEAREQRGFPEVLLHPNQIAAIYPLRGQSVRD